MQLAGTVKVFLNRIRKILMYYYYPLFTGYWDSPTSCVIKKSNLDLGEYYLDLRSKYHYPGNFDADGIPLFKSMVDGSENYHPTVICNYALATFSLMTQKNFMDEKLNRQFFNQADWFVNNQKKLKVGFGWYLNYGIEVYGLQNQWISALTQGEAISVLCRAYKFSKDEIYLSTAKKALMPFYYDVSEGGLINHFGGIMIFEEYPSRKTNVVLNGFIFAILGIYDLYLTKMDNTVKELFESSIFSLKNILRYFDIGYWSQYNLFKFPSEYPASFGCHLLHTEQMKVLYTLTQDQLFLSYYEKWKFYSNSFYNKSKALTKRILMEMGKQNDQGKIINSKHLYK